MGAKHSNTYDVFTKINRGLKMAKEKVHEFVVRIKFNKPISKADARNEVKEVAAFSYETHYTEMGDYTDKSYPTTFRVGSVKHHAK